MKRLLITIDGPAGAGKTTVSRRLAARLGYTYVDTGALYRGVALEAMAAGLAPDDDQGLAALCGRLQMTLLPGPQGVRLLVNAVDVSARIRTPEVTMFASAASARPAVRSFLLDVQRELGRKKEVVFEGRDMGTVVFPDADVKFYLEASVQIRALRRYREMEGQTSQTLAQVEEDIRRRDRNDSSRALAPLKPAPDALIIDSSHLTIEAVVAKMLARIEQALADGEGDR